MTAIVASKNFWLWGTWGRRQIKVAFCTEKVPGATSTAVVGATFIITLQTDSSIRSWGEDFNGCLGLGEEARNCQEPREITLCTESELKVVDLQIGRQHILSRTACGKVFSWGANRHGQLGVGDTRNRYNPVCVVIGGPQECRVSQIVARGDTSFALTQEGIVFAWGANKAGVLGLESEAEQVVTPQPMLAMRDTNIKTLQCEGMLITACVQDASTEKEPGTPHKNFWMWGQLGTRMISKPALTEKLSTEIQSVFVGPTFTIALQANGSLVSWGEDSSGCLGAGLNKLNSSAPVTLEFPVNFSGEVVDVQLGSQHVLALTSQGAVYSWGANVEGQLGIGDTDARYEPTHVYFEDIPGVEIRQIVVAETKNYALSVHGLVFAWGNNKEGSLALEHDVPKILLPHLLVRLLDTPIKSLKMQSGGPFCAFIGGSNPMSDAEIMNLKNKYKAAALVRINGEREQRERHERDQRAAAGWTAEEEQELARLVALLPYGRYDAEGESRTEELQEQQRQAEQAVREFEQKVNRCHSNAGCQCAIS